MRPERINLTMKVEDASYVQDALGYYLSASEDNFGGGYDSDSTDGDEQFEQRERVKSVHDRLGKLLEEQ